MSEAKEKLINLESSGKFVFHGSDVGITEFEPRQAHNHVGGQHVPDGDPAIFASSVVDYAIFMAIINKTNCPKGYRASSRTTAGVTTFKTDKKTLDQLKDTSSGWVYVFDKNKFSKRKDGGVEYSSSVKLTPIESVRVLKEDLPNIGFY